MGILIKNGWVINPATQVNEKMDLLIEGATVKALGQGLEDQVDQVIDATGLWVVPGLVDVHTHLREPGYEYKEDIETGTASAVAGGITTVCCMPNTKPTTDSGDVVDYIIQRTAEKGACHVIPVGAITLGQKGETLAPISEMLEKGAGAISEDGRSVLDAKILKAAMVKAKELNIPVLSHCEDEALATGGCMNEGLKSQALGLQGIHNDAEDLITARDILLSKSTGAHLHLCHVSTAGSVELIRQAKAEGLNVTAEVCPHHFTLTEEVINGQNTETKMNPPLRTKTDIEAILQGIKDGTLDCIATDHAPHSAEDKAGGFAQAANGIVGFETSFALSKTFLVDEGVLTPMTLIERMSTNPAKMMGLDKGDLSVGKMADITLIDPEKVWTVDSKEFKTKGRNTPFEGWELKGRIEVTIVEGKVAYKR